MDRKAIDRIKELDAEIAAATQWGAALTVANEERQSLLRYLSAEDRAQLDRERKPRR